jgi:hypothetical protein
MGMKEEDNLLYICSASGTDHCNDVAECEHKEPHEVICIYCQECDEDECECGSDLNLCTLADLCRGNGSMIHVKCIPYDPDFIKDDEMKI